MNYAFYSILFLLVAAGSTLAQTGKVQDEQGQGIPSAVISVHAFQGMDTTYLTYTKSNAQGQFTIVLPAGSLKNVLIRVHAMSYAPTQLPAGQWVAPHTITLKSRPVQLGEVVITRPRPPVQIRGDTLEFNVQSFANGTERSVEDLLKRLPGLEVRSDGRLYYNNRLIRKLYLDGQELFSQNYTLLTKNLAANLIDKVQAIEHHTENPLLRGIERSDETVLNLQVKAERKTRLMGNVAVESGTLKRGSLNGSLFSLKGRTKVGIIGSANTIGQEVASPFPNALTGDAAFMSLAPVVKSQRLANVGLGIITPNEVERRRFLFNQAALLGTDVNVQLFRNLKLKVEGNGWRDRQQAEAITTTELTLPERKIRLQDSTRQTEKPRQWNGRLRLDYTPGTRQSFRWIAEMNSQEQTQRNQLYTANLALTERVRLGSTLRSQSQHHELEWVHKLRSQDAFIVTTNLTSVTQPLTADFTSQRYALFYGLNPADYPGLHYDIHQRRNQWQASIFWKASRRKDSTSQSKTYWKVGIESHWQSDGFRSGYSGPELPDSSWAISGAYRQWVVVPLAEVKQQNRRWGYTFQVTLPWYQLEHTEAVRRTNLRSTRMQPNGMLGLSYQTPSLRQLFSLNLTHRVQVPGVESIWDSFQPSSYRSFYRGLAAFRPVKTTNGLLLFRHNQLASYLTLMGNISYQLRSKGVIPRYTVTDLFSFSSLVPFEGSIQDWHIQGVLDKYFPPIAMKLRFESTLHRGQQPTLINSSQRVQILPFQSMSYKVYLLSTFDGAVNAELSFMYRQLTSRTVTDVRQKTTTLQPRLLLTGKLHREWSVQLWNEGLFWRSRYSQTNFYLVDASVRYRPVEKPWEVELVGQNLLNTRYYFTTSLNAVYLDESSYRLQPRYVALRMNWRF